VGNVYIILWQIYSGYHIMKNWKFKKAVREMPDVYDRKDFESWRETMF